MSAGYTLGLTLNLKGPVFSEATGEPKFGLDATQARAGGRPILPGSHIKGHLRYVLEQAEVEGVPCITKDWIARWFGKPSGSPAFDPCAGQLSVSDLVAEASGCRAVTRIAIDESRGSVREGMMQFVEAPWAYGEPVKFKGELRLHGTADTKDLDLLAQALGWALQLIPAVGAFKTAGFGRLESASLASTWSALHVATNTGHVEGIENAGGADLRLTPLEPFVVWSYSHGGNFFSGDTVIPGQVLKAVAAGWLTDRGLLTGKEDLFARLIFRHAHPVPNDLPDTPRPIAMPLSICKVDDGCGPVFHDVLEDPSGHIELARAKATVTFKPDWKGLPQELSFYGPRIVPRRDSRTRTAVTNYIAADEQLFTHVGVDPEGCVWQAQILIPPDAEPEERTAMAELIAALEGTSLGLGKTKVPMCWTPEPLAQKPTADRHESGWRVVLQTPACLHGPYCARSDTGDRMEDLRKDYESYWQDVLEGAGRLVDFMARQRLAGGYLARRYPVSSGGYEPYLLTEEGSIFLIKENGSDAVADGEPRAGSQQSNALSERLNAFAAKGLPLGGVWQSPNWRNHPFLPEAGWGEVRISQESPIPVA